MGTASHVVNEALRGRACSPARAGEYTVRLLPPLVATRDELALGLRNSRRDPVRPTDVVDPPRASRGRRADRRDSSPLFADEALMLRRTPEMVELAIDDYVVGVDPRGRVVACGALKEYSPSVAEVAAIAVSRDVHGQRRRAGRSWRRRGAGDQARHLRRVRADAAAGVLRRDRISAGRPRAISGEDSARLSGVRAPLRVQRDLLREESSGRRAERRRSRGGDGPRNRDRP